MQSDNISNSPSNARGIDPRMIEAVRLHRAGQLIQAEVLYREIAEMQPDFAEARHNLGTLLAVSGRAAEALPWVQSAVDLQPHNAVFKNSLAEILQFSTQTSQPATQSISSLLPEKNSNDTIPPPDSSDKLKPSAGECAEASRLFETGQLDKATIAGQALIRLYPSHCHGWLVLACCLHAQDRIGEAAVAIDRAFALEPNNPAILNTRAVICKLTGRLKDAEENLLAAARLAPGHDKVQSNLGIIYLHTGRTHEAEAAFRRAALLAPTSAEAHNNLGVAQRDLCQFHNSEKSILEALRLKPDYADAWSNLGVVHRELGQLPQAELAYRKALELSPRSWSAYSNLLFARNYTDGQLPLTNRAEAQQFGEEVHKAVRQIYSSWNVASDTPLRIGFVSGDLHEHAVAYFLSGWLRHIDPALLTLIAYNTNSLAETAPGNLKPQFAEWHPVYGLTDDEAAAKIHNDGIHILIDLSGHTAHNRLAIFARKPAPVQISWLGYFATTGIKEIDYVLADHRCVPPEHKEHFIEKIWYLDKTRMCFTPPVDAPDISRLPALTNQYITFGTFQNFSKMTDSTLELWSQVLDSVPNARLRVQCRQLLDTQVKQVLESRFERAGIRSEQLDFVQPVSRYEYLSAHAAVDIILDTFPFTGGTTTCEALWMGVPTLTLCGERMINRQGASLLGAAEMDEWVAMDKSAYLQKAGNFAGNFEALATLRQGLRSHVKNTALFSAPEFAKSYEFALLNIWKSIGASTATS